MELSSQPALGPLEGHNRTASILCNVIGATCTARTSRVEPRCTMQESASQVTVSKAKVTQRGTGLERAGQRRKQQTSGGGDLHLCVAFFCCGKEGGKHPPSQLGSPASQQHQASRARHPLGLYPGGTRGSDWCLNSWGKR